MPEVYCLYHESEINVSSQYMEVHAKLSHLSLSVRELCWNSIHIFHDQKQTLYLPYFWFCGAQVFPFFHKDHNYNSSLILSGWPLPEIHSVQMPSIQPTSHKNRACLFATLTVVITLYITMSCCSQAYSFYRLLKQHGPAQWTTG